MAIADCIKSVLEKFPNATVKDVQGLFDSMTRERQQAFNAGLANPNSEFAAKSEKLLNSFVEMVHNERNTALQNLATKARQVAFFENQAFKSKAEGMLAAANGTSKKIDGGRDSFQSRELGLRRIIGEAFLSQLDEKKNPGITKIFTSDALGREIAQQVYVLAGGKELPGPVPEEAKIIAEAWHKTNKLELQLLRKAGANVNDLEGFIARQSHDPNEIRSLGNDNDSRFKAWTERLMGGANNDNRLNMDKTFFRDFFPIDPEKYLRSAFDDIMKERGKVLTSDISDNFVKIIGTPSDMARRAEMGRKIFFKDGYAEYDYNKELGKKTMAEQFMSSMRSTAKSVALMEKFTTNPKAFWEANQVGMTDAEKKLLSNVYAAMDGSSSVPGNSPVAAAGAYASKALDVAKMGKVVSSHFGIIMSRGAEMSINGETLLSAQAKSLTSFLENIPKENQREVMRLTGANVEAIIGHMTGDVFAGETQKAGLMGKMHELMFRLNGMKRVVEAMDAGHGQISAMELGANAGKTMGNLPAGLGRTLARFGFSPIDWEVARMAVEDHEKHGPMLGFGKILDIPNEKVVKVMTDSKMIPDGSTPGMIEKMANKYKFELQQKLAGYFGDRSDASMGRPGINEKAKFLERGSVPDTAAGQAWRLFMKYKAFPISMTTRWGDMIANELLAEQTHLQKAGTVTVLATSGLLLGYLGLAASEAMSNRSPPDPRSLDTFAKSATKGGMLGYLGDMLASQVEQKGKMHGALSTVAGPFFGQMDDVGSILSDLVQSPTKGRAGRLQKAGAQALRVAKNNAPFSNAPVLRAALDQVFLNHLAEVMNPGYLARQRTKMKESGQSSIFGH